MLVLFRPHPNHLPDRDWMKLPNNPRLPKSGDRVTLESTRGHYPLSTASGTFSPGKTDYLRSMSSKPWYHQGLRFRCVGCGGCCTGEPGYVWLNAQEIAALAAFLRLKISSFERKFIRRIGIRACLVELPNGDCVFFDRGSRQCRVYQFRPRQCQTWPFWHSNLRSPEAWQLAGKRCPGIDHGPLVPVAEILRQAEEVHV
jgi:Fe-S-cluster containining protein